MTYTHTAGLRNICNKQNNITIHDDCLQSSRTTGSKNTNVK